MGGRRVRVVWRGECGFSSLLKQKIKTKNKKKLLRHLQRRNFFLKKLCYEVFAKQTKAELADNYYLCERERKRERAVEGRCLAESWPEPPDLSLRKRICRGS